MQEDILSLSIGEKSHNVGKIYIPQHNGYYKSISVVNTHDVIKHCDRMYHRRDNGFCS